MMAKITTTYKGDMLFETPLGSHTLVTDVPAPMGGKDRAPTPPQIFVASLSTCVGAMVTNYCQNNGIDVEGLTVDVDFEKTDSPTRLTDLKITINMPNGDYIDREKAIRRVAEHCPVHETIISIESMEIAMVANGNGKK
jgi:putative redox protein